MSKPAGKCAFCGGKPLSKGHIWPESFGKIITLEPRAKYHEQRVGGFSTFDSKLEGPPKWVRAGTGPLSKKRPRNTCIKCNGGWMSRLEQSSLHAVEPLVLGKPALLGQVSQRLLASILCLISMRIELTARPMKTIPDSDRHHLMETFTPSVYWRIWVGRFGGDDLEDYNYRYTAHQVASSPDIDVRGPDHCNTQITSIVVGQLYAILYFSTFWLDFPGFEGPMPLWPPIGPWLDTTFLPIASEADVAWLQESVARNGKRA